MGQADGLRTGIILLALGVVSTGVGWAMRRLVQRLDEATRLRQAQVSDRIAELMDAVGRINHRLEVFDSRVWTTLRAHDRRISRLEDGSGRPVPRE